MAAVLVITYCAPADGRQQQDEDLLPEPESKVQLEYKVIRTAQFNCEDFQSKLNDLGRYGWEFSGTAHLGKSLEEFAIFRRAKKSR
jgi:hypothetical protein